MRKANFRYHRISVFVGITGIKKKKIKKIHTRVCIYVYIRIHKEEEEEEEEILGEIQRRPFRKWWRRVAAKLPSLAAPR